ncbi:MAG: hypothetical protein NC093_10330, partial [Alistipes sp.]|nr:hypothetical protein [Alistipes sp.]
SIIHPLSRRCIIFVLCYSKKWKTVETKVSIDGGKLMKVLIVTIILVQLGIPAGVCGVRSQLCW